MLCIGLPCQNVSKNAAIVADSADTDLGIHSLPDLSRYLQGVQKKTWTFLKKVDVSLIGENVSETFTHSLSLATFIVYMHYNFVICDILYILYVLGHCLFWDTLDFAKIIIFQGCKFWDISKIEEKMGNFEILSFGTHQNSTFLAEILTLKIHAYSVIFVLFITQICQ